jgi:hypothetical protein
MRTAFIKEPPKDKANIEAAVSYQLSAISFQQETGFLAPPLQQAEVGLAGDPALARG